MAKPDHRGSHSLPYLVWGTIYGKKIAVDGPGGKVVAGDHLWRDSSLN